MRRKYQLIIIICVSSLLAYLIYFFNREVRINFVALGDGVASGETPYNIDGISYNDYLKAYYENKKLLKNYSKEYAKKNYQLEDLITDIKSNVIKKKNQLSIQQLIHKANIITISMGEEELIKTAITKELNQEYIKKFIKEYDNLIYLIRDITDAKIVIIGFYENSYLSKSDVIILNAEIANIALKYNCLFINISDLMLNNSYLISPKSYYFNYKGHLQIAEMIAHSL